MAGMSVELGFAREEITPPLGLPLLGYEFRAEVFPQGNEGVLDDLYVRTLVFRNVASGQRFALISLDVCILLTPFARGLREKVAAVLDCPMENVIVACTHTHSAPFLGRSGAVPELGPLQTADVGDAEARWTREVVGKVVQSVRRAAGLLMPVDVSFCEAALGLGYNRRVKTTEGVRLCWNPVEFPDLQPGPHPDATCSLLKFGAVGGCASWLVWSVGVHPVVLGKTSNVVSADWPGAALAVVEEALPCVEALFLQGASGEVHPVLATQDRPEAVLRVGRAMGEGVACLQEMARKRLGEIEARAKVVEISGAKLDLVVWRICGVYLVAMPVEWFASLSARLRGEMAGTPLVFATLANGWECYWPDEAAFAEGGYEVEAALKWGRKAGDGERLLDEVRLILSEFSEK